ncbi:hypothetical protein QVD17_23320 [Tagetes erecta]|uniref:RING-type E3 ubiquitin transferase n=1 Tax=Tagetes erecta TaxID=13708 RepID=A0AAD8KDZ2_TARER|nr:hypothetical protein QVD17_23320 [Tagetes erecta]
MNNITIATASPPYATLSPIRNPAGSHDYLFVVGFFCTVLLLFTIVYASYSCKHSRSPTHATAYNNESDDNLVRFSRGLDDDVLVTIPTFVYSETRMAQKVETATDADDSGCSICLEDYKPDDVVRLFPECGHLFHVTCIDTWLKANPTCPVCRNFAGIKSTDH